MSTSAATSSAATSSAATDRLTTTGCTGAVLAVLGRRALVSFGATMATVGVLLLALHLVGRWRGWDISAGGAPFAGVVSIEAPPGSVVVRGLEWFAPVSAAWVTVVLAASLPRLTPALVGLGATRRAVTTALFVVLSGLFLATALVVAVTAAVTTPDTWGSTLAGAVPTLLWLLVVILAVACVAALSVHRVLLARVVASVGVLVAVAVGVLGLGFHAGAALPVILAVVLGLGLVLLLRRLPVE